MTSTITKRYQNLHTKQQVEVARRKHSADQTSTGLSLVPSQLHQDAIKIVEQIEAKLITKKQAVRLIKMLVKALSYADGVKEVKERPMIISSEDIENDLRKRIELLLKQKEAEYFDPSKFKG